MCLPEFPVGEHGEQGVEEAREAEGSIGERFIGELEVGVEGHQPEACGVPCCQCRR